jgi:hypothetical protein
MDGPFWVDTRAPHIAADIAAVTLATTFKAIVPPANLPVLGSNYFGYIGKACRMKMFGRMTAVASPGNLGIALYWGTGADANGTAIISVAAAAAQALTAGTNLTFELEFLVRCRAQGASGALIGHGMLSANPLLVASSLQPIMMPASAPAPVTVDLTQNFVLSPQLANTAGSSVQIHEYVFEAIN